MSLRAVLIVVLGFAAIALVACGGPDTSTPENLAKLAVEAIQDNDFDKFQRLCVDKQTLYQILEDSTFSDDDKVKFKSKIDDRLPRFQKEMRESFENIRQEAKKDGVELGEIKFVNTEYKVKTRKGIQEADIYVFLEHGNSTYKLKLDDCFKSKKGWRIGDDLRWYGKAK